MAVSATNTFAEGLSKLNVEIAKMKTLPDIGEPELQKLIELETHILSILRAPAEQALQSGAPPSGGGMPTGMGGPAAAPPMMGSPEMSGGIRATAPQPSNDELRRLLPPDALQGF